MSKLVWITAVATVISMAVTSLALNIGDDSVISSRTDTGVQIQAIESTEIEPYCELSLGSLDSITSLLNIDSMESYTLALQALGPRFTGDGSDIPSRDWLFAELTDFGYDPVLEDFYFPYINDYAQNVVAYKDGTSRSDQYIVLGAHFDTQFDTPGAIDNASGCAAILEMARLLWEYETQATVVFAFFNAEEAGWVGSLDMAKSFSDNGDSIIVMATPDEVGGAICPPMIAMDLGPNITTSLILEYLSLELPSIDLPVYIEDSIAIADRVAFDRYGFNNFWIGGCDTGRRHTPSDSAVYLDYDLMVRQSRSILATILVMDCEYDPRPCCTGLSGNVDGDPEETVDIGDLTKLIDYLYISTIEPDCLEEGNVDGLEAIDIGDLTALIDYLYISTTPPAPCQ